MAPYRQPPQPCRPVSEGTRTVRSCVPFPIALVCWQSIGCGLGGQFNFFLFLLFSSSPFLSRAFFFKVGRKPSATTTVEKSQFHCPPPNLLGQAVVRCATTPRSKDTPARPWPIPFAVQVRSLQAWSMPMDPGLRCIHRQPITGNVGK